MRQTVDWAAGYDCPSLADLGHIGLPPRLAAVRAAGGSTVSGLISACVLPVTGHCRGGVVTGLLPLSQVYHRVVDVV